MTAPFISKAPVYAVGTASMTNGSAVVAFSGANLIQTDPTTGLQASVVTVGDMLVVPGLAGGYGIIQSIDSASQVTLATPWAAASQAGVAYAIYRYATPASGVALAAFNAATTLGQDSNPVASQAVDDGTARIKIKVVSGQPTIAVGAHNAADASLVSALAINAATGAVSFPAGAVSPAPVDHNPLVNSSFEIWQSGTSWSVASGATQRVADGWLVGNGVGGAAAVSQIAAPAGAVGRYALNVAATGAGAGNYVEFRQRFEAHRVQHLDSVASALSFYVQASTSAGALTGTVYFLGNTAYDNGTFSAAVNASGIPFSVPVGGGRVTVPVPASLAIGMKLGVDLYLRFTQTGGTGNVSIAITDVQWDLGPVAQPFMARTLDREWPLCWRYYQSINFPLSPVFMTYVDNGDTRGLLPLLTKMRATPTVALSASSWLGIGVMPNGQVINSTFDVVPGLVGDASVSLSVSNSASLAPAHTVLAWSSNVPFTLTADARL